MKNVILSLIAVIVCSELCGCSRSDSRAREILGRPLPASATDIHVSHFELVRRDGMKIETRDFLAVAISREDYATLVGQLGLRHMDSVTWGNWPGPFKYPDIAFEGSPVGLWTWKGDSDKQHALWWTVTNTNDEDTFGDYSVSLLNRTPAPKDLTDITNTASRYENGHLFFSRQIAKWGGTAPHPQ